MRIGRLTIAENGKGGKDEKGGKGEKDGEGGKGEKDRKDENGGKGETDDRANSMKEKSHTFSTVLSDLRKICKSNDISSTNLAENSVAIEFEQIFLFGNSQIKIGNMKERYFSPVYSQINRRLPASEKERQSHEDIRGILEDYDNDLGKFMLRLYSFDVEFSKLQTGLYTIDPTDYMNWKKASSNGMCNDLSEKMNSMKAIREDEDQLLEKLHTDLSEHNKAYANAVEQTEHYFMLYAAEKIRTQATMTTGIYGGKLRNDYSSYITERNFGEDFDKITIEELKPKINNLHEALKSMSNALEELFKEMSSIKRQRGEWIQNLSMIKEHSLDSPSVEPTKLTDSSKRSSTHSSHTRSSNTENSDSQETDSRKTDSPTKTRIGRRTIINISSLRNKRTEHDRNSRSGKRKKNLKEKICGKVQIWLLC